MRGTLMALCCGLALGTATTASADHHLTSRVAVLDPAGPGGARLGSQVRALIGADWDVANLNLSQRWRKRLLARGAEREHVTTVAERSELTGLIVSSVHDKAGRLQLELRLFDGHSGVILTVLTVHLQTLRLRGPARKLVRAWLAKGLQILGSQADDAERAAMLRPRGSSREKRSRRSSQRNPRNTRVRNQRLHDQETLSGVRFSVGPSVVKRRLRFAVSADMAVPPADLATTATGIYARIEWYPLSDSSREGLGKLGLGCVGERALSIGLDGATTEVDAVSQASSAVGTQTRWGVYLLYPLWHGASGASLTATAGYNRLSFAIERDAALPAALQNTPSSAYTYVDPGISVGYPLSTSVKLTASTRGLLLRSAGEITQMQEYGAATAVGFQAGAELSLALSRGLAASMGVDYRAIGFDFDGTGQRAGDGIPENQDVGGAQDSYISAFAALVYRH